MASRPICRFAPVSSSTFCAPATQTRSTSRHPPRSNPLTHACALRHRLRHTAPAVRSNGLPHKPLDPVVHDLCARSLHEGFRMTHASRLLSRSALGILAAATFSTAACDGTGGTGLTGILRSSATLSGLAVSSGTLSPAFSATTTSYQVAVPFATSSFTVTPTAATSGATITVNGATVPSGTASGPINLAVGTNTIAVVVTNPDGLATRTYTITVIRASF